MSFLAPLVSDTFLAVEPPAPRFLTETLKAEFVQKYSLSLLHAEFTQSYSDTLHISWTQPYSELQFVQNEVLSSSYKLGFDDVAMDVTQLYGMSVESAIKQPYSSLQFVQKEVARTPYKLGFDEVSTEITQSYSLELAAQFSQAYSSLIHVDAEIVQPYTTSVEAHAEFKTPYDLLQNDIVSFKLTSHYTMYESSNVIVINTNTGLIYKTGYTESPET